MAWTTPTAYPLGTAITDVIYGLEIVANLEFLHDRLTFPSTGYELVENTVVETAIGQYTVPANALGIYGMCYGEWMLLITTDAARATTIKQYIGATSLFDDTVTTAGVAKALALIRMWVVNAGATNSQICTGEWLNENAVVAGVEAAWDEHSRWEQVAAIDTTAAFTMGPTVTMAAASYQVELVGQNFFGPFLVE